ncbi:MAG: hypothetical protein AAFW81_01015 [Pseudomonadota bacterium]
MPDGQRPDDDLVSKTTMYAIVAGVAVLFTSFCIFVVMHGAGLLTSDHSESILQFIVIAIGFFTAAFTFVLALLAVNTFGAMREVREIRRDAEDMVTDMRTRIEESELIVSILPEYFAEMLHASEDAMQGDARGRRRAHMTYMHLGNWFEMLRLDPVDPGRLDFCREIIGGMSDIENANRRILEETLLALTHLVAARPQLAGDARPLIREAHRILSEMKDPVL